MIGTNIFLASIICGTLALPSTIPTGDALVRRETTLEPDNFPYVKFNVVYTNRNLRGLFPVDDGDEEDGDSTIRESGPLSSELSMVGSGGQVAYVAEVMFGEKGPFKMVIDTGSSDSWLVAESFHCYDTNMKKVENAVCRLGPGYTPSATFKRQPDLHFAIQYGDGEKLLGSVGTETVKVGRLIVPNQRINIVDNAAWNGDSETSGLLGLGLPANTANYMGTLATDVSRPAPYDPIFTTAVKTGLVPSGSFAIALQRDAKTAGQGFLSFGGIPPVRTYGSTATVRYAEPRNLTLGQTEYNVPIQGFKFTGSDAIKNLPAQEGLIDSGTAVMMVPSMVAKAYNALWDPNTQEAPPFSVVIAGVEFPIESSDLRIKSKNGWVSAVLPARKTILGDTFMRNVVSVFDIAAGQMRFVSTNAVAR